MNKIMRPTVKLGELADLQNGYAFKSSDYISKSKTLNFRMSNIRPGGIVDIEYNKKFLPDEYAEIYKDFLLKDGDVVIAMTDMATSPKILAVPCIVNTGGYNVLLNQRVGKFFNVDETRIRKDFLWAVLSSSKIREGLASLGGGGLQINISKKQILDIEIPLPPLETQKVIVAKLDQIFAELDQTKSEIQKNFDNADELWKSSLNQAFQGDWEVKKLGEVCENIFAGGDKPKNFSEEQTEKYKVPVYANGVDKDGLVGFTDVARVNDICLTVSGRGTIGFPVIRENPFVPIVRLIVAIPNKDLNIKYLWYSVLGIDFNDTGVAIPQLTVPRFKEHMITVPPLPKQEKIVEHLDQVSKEVKALKSQYQSQLDNLEELKKSVLDKAFRGELE